MRELRQPCSDIRIIPRTKFGAKIESWDFDHDSLGQTPETEDRHDPGRVQCLLARRAWPAGRLASNTTGNRAPRADPSRPGRGGNGLSIAGQAWRHGGPLRR